MSRQAAPARAQSRPVYEQQARPATEMGAADPVRAAVRFVKVRSLDQDPGAAGGVERIVAEQGQAAAEGGASRSVEQQAAAKIGVAASVEVNELNAGARYQRRFGNNIDSHRIQQFTPDQLLMLYNLLMTSRGENPLDETGYEPMDIDTKTTQSTQSTTDNVDDVLTTDKINALIEAKSAEELNEEVLKLAMILKIKTEEAEAALQFTNEILNDRKEDLKKFNNPDNA